MFESLYSDQQSPAFREVGLFHTDRVTDRVRRHRGAGHAKTPALRPGLLADSFADRLSYAAGLTLWPNAIWMIFASGSLADPCDE